MKISQTLLNGNYPLKYFYCCIDNKEYILSGDDNGYIYDCSFSCNIGNIIIEVLENKDYIYSTIIESINKISNEQYCDDEVNNQDIIWNHLMTLQEKLELSKIFFFRFINIPTYISEKFIIKFNDFNIQKEMYNNTKNTISELKKILDTSTFPNNKFAIDILKKEQEKHKSNIDCLKNIIFKDFTLNELKNFLEDLKLFELNLILYSHKDLELDIIDKLTGKEHINIKAPLQKIKLLQQNYNLNIFNDFYEIMCLSKIVICDNNKIYLDDEINKLSDNRDNLDIKIVEVFKFNTLTQLLNLSLVRIMDKKITLKKCLNCDNYFIPEKRTDEKYCNRISPQNHNKTCKEYGAKKTYRDEIKSIPLKNEHNKASQFFRMRITRAKNQKDEEYYQKEFNIYKKTYQQKKQQYKSGKLKEKDFIDWIIKQKQNAQNNFKKS